MDPLTAAQNSLSAIDRADEEAQQAQLAFVLGDFENLFRKKAAAARARLEATYREINERTAAYGGSAGEAGGSEPAVRSGESNSS